MIKAFVVLAAAAATLVAASDRVSVKGYTSDPKGDLDCKFGSGEIMKKCGACARASRSALLLALSKRSRFALRTSRRSPRTAVAVLSTFSNVFKQG